MLLSAALACIAATGCASRGASAFHGVKQDDLAPGTAALFDRYPNRFYAIPSGSKTDVYVLLLRSNLLHRDGTREPMRSLLALGSLQDRPDCGEIRRKVNAETLEKARQALDGAFSCFDSLLTDREVIARNPILAADSVNSPEAVDAHMGWYAATADRRPVEKLVRNLAQNDLACACIPWPLASIARQDTLFASYLKEETAKYPGNEKIRLVQESIANP